MPTPEEITRTHDPDPDENPWVHGPPGPELIRVVPSDPGWPELYATIRGRVVRALGDRAVVVDHVGSTSVPGLAAKPVIDIDLTVADPADEASYVPALTAEGFDLVVREPSWHEHRLFRLHDPRVNLHVFGPDCPETIRHLIFRDWLRQHADDRARYEAAKRESTEGAADVAEYNQRKQPVILDIYWRAFRAAGLL